VKLGLLRRGFGFRARNALAPHRNALFDIKRPEVLLDAASLERRAIFDAARDLPDDTPCDERVLAAIDGEAHARRTASGTIHGPAIPHFSDLRVRHAGLPEWWHQGNNLALAAPGSGPQLIEFMSMPAPPTNVVMVFGARTSFHLARFIGDNALLMLGDDVALVSSTIVVGADTAVMIGEQSTATWLCSIDARNGATVVFGADTMLASGVWVTSDDSHAIRDMVTDARVNLYGGRIVVDRHVWIGDQVRLMGDCAVGPNAVVGAGTFVKNTSLPANTVSVGRPARPVRTGITWSRADQP
jgi:acetyltransferase-like isoleucine patch superfamily enzyme